MVLLQERSIDHMTQPAASPSLPPRFTDKQGQYLAFIHTYALLNGQAPAEADMQQFFRVTPPSVHNMVMQLERLGLIRRIPRQARSIELLVDADLLPRLRAQPIKTTVGRY
jgi:Mn-dependent DtxR family transcriptional regulator